MKARNLLIGLLLAGVSGVSHGLTAEVLAAALVRGEALTLIDIRSRGDYGRRHIPGAISIPAVLLEHKRLPPLGRVVVYGDGIDEAQARAAKEELDSRPGIEAELLEGGLGAWDTEHLPSTGGRGLRREPVPQLSYRQFERVVAGNPEAVLVDLRLGEELTDLEQQFPGVRRIKPRSEGKRLSVRQLTGRGIDARRLYILIDDGDGRAEQLARRLRAAGMKRVTVLAGGERILRRGGRPGVQTQINGERQ